MTDSSSSSSFDYHKELISYIQFYESWSTNNISIKLSEVNNNIIKQNLINNIHNLSTLQIIKLLIALLLIQKKSYNENKCKLVELINKCKEYNNNNTNEWIKFVIELLGNYGATLSIKNNIKLMSNKDIGDLSKYLDCINIDSYYPDSLKFLHKYLLNNPLNASINNSQVNIRNPIQFIDHIVQNEDNSIEIDTDRNNIHKSSHINNSPKRHPIVNMHNNNNSNTSLLPPLMPPEQRRIASIGVVSSIRPSPNNLQSRVNISSSSIRPTFSSVQKSPKTPNNRPVPILDISTVANLTNVKAVKQSYELEQKQKKDAEKRAIAEAKQKAAQLKIKEKEKKEEEKKQEKLRKENEAKEKQLAKIKALEEKANRLAKEKAEKEEKQAAKIKAKQEKLELERKEAEEKAALLQKFVELQPGDVVDPKALAEVLALTGSTPKTIPGLHLPILPATPANIIINTSKKRKYTKPQEKPSGKQITASIDRESIESNNSVVPMQLIPVDQDTTSDSNNVTNKSENNPIITIDNSSQSNISRVKRPSSEDLNCILNSSDRQLFEDFLSAAENLKPKFEPNIQELNNNKYDIIISENEITRPDTGELYSERIVYELDFSNWAWIKKKKRLKKT